MIILCQFSLLGGGVTPKLWALLDPTYQDSSFGTLESQIRHMVMKLLTVDQNSYKWTDGQTDE